MISKKAIRAHADKLAHLLTTTAELQCLVGRRVVGVAFNGEGEGIYRLEFDDGCTAEFSSMGDDMTFTSVHLTPFQAALAERSKNER